MKRTLLGLTLVLAVAAVTVAGAGEAFSKRIATGGRADGPVIYVTSQGLFFDSVVTADPLPMKGNFQELVVSADGLVTEYGPGDPQYQGGRWWVDVNGSGTMDPDDHFFNCPLLGPGREDP